MTRVFSFVSIPYEREGTFRPKILKNKGGKKMKKFQFPTSGKAHSDSSQNFPRTSIGLSFNSLRAGRHIQTQSWRY